MNVEKNIKVGFIILYQQEPPSITYQFFEVSLENEQNTKNSEIRTIQTLTPTTSTKLLDDDHYEILITNEKNQDETTNIFTQVGDKYVAEFEIKVKILAKQNIHHIFFYTQLQHLFGGAKIDYYLVHPLDMSSECDYTFLSKPHKNVLTYMYDNPTNLGFIFNSFPCLVNNFPANTEKIFNISGIATADTLPSANSTLSIVLRTSENYKGNTPIGYTLKAVGTIKKNNEKLNAEKIPDQSVNQAVSSHSSANNIDTNTMIEDITTNIATKSSEIGDQNDKNNKVASDETSTSINSTRTGDQNENNNKVASDESSMSVNSTRTGDQNENNNKVASDETSTSINSTGTSNPKSDEQITSEKSSETSDPKSDETITSVNSTETGNSNKTVSEIASDESSTYVNSTETDKPIEAKNKKASDETSTSVTTITTAKSSEINPQLTTNMKLSNSSIAGITIGSLIGFVLLVGIIFLIIKKFF